MTQKLTLIILAFTLITGIKAQTILEEAVNFHVKTIHGEPIWLFPLLDDENKTVVIDFFSTTCGPCQDYAPDFQTCYEDFGYNEGNVYFLGINWGNDNLGVFEFDSIFGLTFLSVRGSQGGGNTVYNDYDIQSYPTVIVITPDHNITEQHVWPPDLETITNAVIAASGIYVDIPENPVNEKKLVVYPNPVNDFGKVKILQDDLLNVYVSIANSVGQIVYTSGAILNSNNENIITFQHII
jgi:thiol-disulfide isomerase/thioredoxin